MGSNKVWEVVVDSLRQVWKVGSYPFIITCKFGKVAVNRFHQVWKVVVNPFTKTVPYIGEAFP